MRRALSALSLALALLLPGVVPAALAQQGPGAAPAVGVVKVSRQPVTQSDEYVGRIETTERVNLVARVTAVLDQSLFTEGAEVKKGDVLYRLEQAPFKADVQAKQAVVAQMEAQLKNAELSLFRAKALLHTTAGQQATVDTATANAESVKAQLQGAQAQLLQSQISLGYTEIRAPISGKIGRSAVTRGNVVGPGSGTLTTIVSQDPMYVVFPVPVRTALKLRQGSGTQASLGAAVIKIRLPDGRLYADAGKLDFIDNTTSGSTDTILLRGTLPNPPKPGDKPGAAGARELIDNELVTAILQDARPVEALTIPRAAVLTDQRGDFVYVVDAANKAERRGITLGQSTPATAMVSHGLSEGETVIVEGLQRVRIGQVVAPGPLASEIGSAAPASAAPAAGATAKGASATSGTPKS